jgi:hypothetical protein
MSARDLNERHGEAVAAHSFAQVQERNGCAGVNIRRKLSVPPFSLDLFDFDPAQVQHVFVARERLILDAQALRGGLRGRDGRLGLRFGDRDLLLLLGFDGLELAARRS